MTSSFQQTLAALARDFADRVVAAVAQTPLTELAEGTRTPRIPHRSSGDILRDDVFELAVEGPLYFAVERELLAKALRRSDGNRAAAARLIGIPRKTLLRRLKRVGL